MTTALNFYWATNSKTTSIVILMQTRFLVIVGKTNRKIVTFRSVRFPPTPLLSLGYPPRGTHAARPPPPPPDLTCRRSLGMPALRARQYRLRRFPNLERKPMMLPLLAATCLCSLFNDEHAVIVLIFENEKKHINRTNLRIFNSNQNWSSFVVFNNISTGWLESN